MKNIHIEHLHFHIGEKTILHDITADLPADRFVALLGPNGCGKSTLLKHLYRVHRIQEGQILMDGTPIAEIPLRAAAQEIGVMGQFHSVDFDFTVEEIALMGRAPYKESFEEDTAADSALVHAALERVGMADAAQRSFNELSGGEQQRVMLARCLVQEPSCSSLTSRRIISTSSTSCISSIWSKVSASASSPRSTISTLRRCMPISSSS